MKAAHAFLTLVVGVTVGAVWLATFWRNPRAVSLPVLLAPVAAALLGLSHWVAYEFVLGHWAGDISLLQAIFNVVVAGALLARRAATQPD